MRLRGARNTSQANLATLSVCPGRQTWLSTTSGVRQASLDSSGEASTARQTIPDIRSAPPAVCCIPVRPLDDCRARVLEGPGRVADILPPGQGGSGPWIRERSQSAWKLQCAHSMIHQDSSNHLSGSIRLWLASNCSTRSTERTTRVWIMVPRSRLTYG